MNRRERRSIDRRLDDLEEDDTAGLPQAGLITLLSTLTAGGEIEKVDSDGERDLWRIDGELHTLLPTAREQLLNARE